MQTLTFTQAVEQAELLARQALPAVQHERLSCAVALVQEGKVVQADDHTWRVASTSRPDVTYSVNGACGCEDSIYRAPHGRCKHVLATLLARKALQLMQEAQAAPTARVVPPSTPGEPGAQAEPPAGIDPRFLVHIRQKPFIRYAGLLRMAYDHGLCKLETTFISVTSELALAQCTATFTDGKVVTDVADSTPGNVGAQVKPHWPRLAATRAAARALRNALALDVCALEEIEDGGAA
jgi:hypothetical protein